MTYKSFYHPTGYLYALKKRSMTHYTRLGKYFNKKSVNKAEVSRKTGLNKTRIAELATLERAKLRYDELYLIALAIDVDPCEMLQYLCEGLKLKE